MFTYERILAKLLAVILLTIIIPLFFLILFKPLNIIDSFDIKKVKQRRIPLLLFTLISAIIVNYIFDPVHYIIPFYFFSSVFICGLVSSAAAFLNYKISLHAVGITNFATFIIAFNLYYNINDLFVVSMALFAVGWVLSSRLSLRAHPINELLSGTLLGITSQLLLMQFWFI